MQNTAMGATRRRLVIHGRVQGVGFRESLRREALRCALRGWVRNRTDGTVEALLEGPEDAVDRVTAWARRGPPAARVDRVDLQDAGPDAAPEGFDRLPTL